MTKRITKKTLRAGVEQLTGTQALPCDLSDVPSVADLAKRAVEEGLHPDVAKAADRLFEDELRRLGIPYDYKIKSVTLGVYKPALVEALGQCAEIMAGTRSWVVWFKDGRYAFAWGSTAEEARCNYLKEWSEGIARVAPASDHPDQLPPQNYVHGFRV